MKCPQRSQAERQSQNPVIQSGFLHIAESFSFLCQILNATQARVSDQPNKLKVFPVCAQRALGLSCYWKTVPSQCSGVGKTFWRVSRTVPQTRKVKKATPKLLMNRLSEGYKRAVDKIWAHMAKNGFSGRKSSFRAPKKSLRRGKVVLTKKYPFSQIDISF